MSWLVVSCWLIGLAVADPCSDVQPFSHCHEGVCDNLVWINVEFSVYTFDNHSVVRGPAMGCAEAGLISMNKHIPLVEFVEFNFEKYEELRGLFVKATETVSWVFNRFPLIESDLMTDTTESVLALVAKVESESGKSDLEITTAKQRIASSEIFNELVGTVEDCARMIALTPYHSEFHTLLGQFAFFANFVEFLDTRISFDEISHVLASFPSLSLRPSHSPVHGFALVVPLTKNQPDRGVNLREQVELIIQHALAYRMAKLTGHPSPPISLSSDSVILSEVVRLLANPRTECSEYSVLQHFFVHTVCVSLAEVGDYMFFLGEGDNKGVGIGHILATAGRLCQASTSPEARIRLSMAMSGTGKFVRKRILYLQRAKYFGDSESFLMDPKVELRNDWIVITEGAEQVGYVGVRKEWISNMVEKFFCVENSNGSWEYTDDRELLITVRSGLIEGTRLRAAGRLIGLSMKYDVPIGVPLARSVLGALQMSAVDMDALLEEEDPGFLGNIEKITNHDWTKETTDKGLDWITFADLIPNGEETSLSETNAARFVKLSKEKKLFWNKKDGLRHFRKGIIDVLGAGIFGLLTPEEFQARVLKRPEGFSAELLLNGIVWRNINPDSVDQVALKQWFAHIVTTITDEEREAFNRFVTGSAHPPVNAKIIPWIRIFFHPALSADSLPRSHTCHNELQLPLYTSEDVLRTKLLQAVMEAGTVEGYQGYEFFAET